MDGANNANRHCTGTAVIPEGVVNLDYGSFSNQQITSVQFPSTLTTITTAAFAGAGLTTVNIPSNVTSIGGQAFQGDHDLRSVTIAGHAGTPTSFGSYAFNDTTLDTLTVGTSDNLVTLYQTSLNGLNRATSLTLGAGVSLNPATAVRFISPNVVNGTSVTTFYNYSNASLTGTGFDSLLPAFTLSASSGTAQAGVPFTTGYSIVRTGLAATSYSISPSISNGLSFSTTTGLITGTPTAAAAAQSYQITGINGNNSASATYSLTINVPVPGAPTSLSGVTGNGSAIISFTPGASASFPITNYKYSLDGSTYTALSPAVSSSPVTITGLTAGQSYSISLKAVNSQGDSAASTPLNLTINQKVTTQNISITAPTYGATPQSSITDNGQFTASISWSGGSQNPVTTFGYATVYTANVVITPDSGYSLLGVSANYFTVNGNPATSGNALNAGSFTYVFPATSDAPPPPIITCTQTDATTTPFTFAVPLNGVINSFDLEHCGGVATLPDGVTQLNGAFIFTDNQGNSNTNLTAINLPPTTLTQIGDYAFAELPKITRIEIPSSVTYVGFGAFRNATSLRQIIYRSPSSTMERKEANLQGVRDQTDGGVGVVATFGDGSGTFQLRNKSFNDYVATVSFGTSPMSIGYGNFRNISTLTTLDFGTGKSGITSIVSHDSAWYSANDNGSGDSFTGLTNLRSIRYCGTFDSTNALYNAVVANLITARGWTNLVYCSASAPAITSISPSNNIGAPTSVTITGTNFRGVTGAVGVSFGTIPAANYTVVSDTQINATISTNLPVGSYDLLVSTVAGTSAAVAGDVYVVATIPGAPTGVAGTVANASSLVSWNAPASNGGIAITSYAVTASPGGFTCTTSTTSCTVSGLTNGTAYTFTVVARNAAGDSIPSSASLPVTPADRAIVIPVPILAPVVVPAPDQLQQSKITSISASTAIAGTSTPLVISGSFVEKISAIQINGVALAAGSWSQSPTSVSFTLPGKSAGTYQIQLFNGSAPVLKVQSFTFTAPIVAATPTPTPNPTAKAKVIYIRCVKAGRGTRIAYGVNPVCPAGFTRQ